MDEETINRGRDAEKRLKTHHHSCTEGCQRLGAFEKGRLHHERCDSGREFYTSLLEFRPKPILGSHVTPNGERYEGLVVEKVENVGPYQIAYTVRDTSREVGMREWARHGEAVYLVYVDGKFEGHHWTDVTLDILLLAAMEFRITGEPAVPRTAGYYARKILESARFED